MEENQVSRTSLFTAYARAYHVMHHSYKIFDDFLAHPMLTEEVRTTMERNMPEAFKFITLNVQSYALTKRPHERG